MSTEQLLALEQIDKLVAECVKLPAGASLDATGELPAIVDKDGVPIMWLSWSAYEELASRA